MRHLLLLRHAKSAWDEPELADVERPLAPRGRKAAPLLAHWLDKEQLTPDLVLCSPARRVQETWELMCPVLGEGIPIKTLRTLYLAGPGRLLGALRRTPEDVRTLLLIGHNPGLAGLAVSLCGVGREKALARMARKFPTAALAVISFDAEQWSTIGEGGGKLEAFVRPKDLA
jgi:phosphohistidine phosphatase